MRLNIKNTKLNIPAIIVKFFPYLIFMTIAILCLNNCFFHDTIQLSSKHATWYYDNNFSHFLLPNEIDSGHPPLNGIMLATLWKIFGRSLWVGHAFIAIWTLILIFQIQKVCSHFFSENISSYIALAVLMDATLLAQSSLVSPDIILMTAFFTSIRAIFENKKWLLSIAIIFLSLISMRGMMCTAAIFCFDFFYQYKIDKKLSIKKVVSMGLPFLPGVIAAFAFLCFHYYKLGWIGYHANMPWAEAFAKITSFKEFVIHVVVMVWRLIDFGRIVIWGLLFFSIFFFFKNKIKFTFSLKQISIIVLLIIMLLISSYSFLFHKCLAGTRYLLPHYTLSTIIAFILLDKFCSHKKIKIVAIIVSLILLSGNFVKYPEKISTSWDSTLSHLTFYKLREQMLGYIIENNIPPEKISAGLNMEGNQNNIDLTSPKNMIINNFDNFLSPEYILYSNIFNYDDALIDKLHNSNDYLPLKRVEKGYIFIVLYKKRI
ncbi:MAG: hypothetical protein LBV69_05170 [Bacteroidales bacterium]|jgi:hypothetical protein|nr:hypothetical protein [Bacteroidales bacterium]